MHLDEPQRRMAMPRVAGLIRPRGHLIMSFRHGPVPLVRRMFDVSAEDTIGLAAQQELRPILQLRTESVQEANRLAGVTWTHPHSPRVREKLSPAGVSRVALMRHSLDDT
jgi:hypothetical protein